jgi:type I restriction enzyme S subunit
MVKTNNTPSLRFKEFRGEWSTDRVDNVLERYVNPVKVDTDQEYYQIGIRSHGKGVFHKEPVLGKTLGDKRVFWIEVGLFVVNIVFAWEHAIAITSEKEVGMIASHRFPMYQGKNGLVSSSFVWRFFSRRRGKYLLQLASPGGAGRNKTLGQQNFNELKIAFPTLPEQQKVAAFLSAVDQKLAQLKRKKALLDQYKKGMMQKLFSRELRFKTEEGNDYPDWEEKRLGEIATFSKGKGISKGDIQKDGALECIRYGELYTIYGETIKQIVSKTDISSKDLILSEEGDVVIPASGETQIDIATASCIRKEGVALGGDLNIIRSKQDGVFLAYYLNNALKLDIARLAQGISVVHLYASQLKGLKLSVPSLPEQRKIATYLSALDTKIEAVGKQVCQTEQFKKGLLQQMFV